MTATRPESAKGHGGGSQAHARRVEDRSQDPTADEFRIAKNDLPGHHARISWSAGAAGSSLGQPTEGHGD
jgi:hypothetical protein